MEELNYKTIFNYLSLIYKNHSTQEIDKICKAIKKLFPKSLNKDTSNELWSEKDCFLITYADSVTKKSQNNLVTLKVFLEKYCKEFSHIHILPFYPYSSDDGFAVIDYKKSKKNMVNGEIFQSYLQNLK